MLARAATAGRAGVRGSWAAAPGGSPFRPAPVPTARYRGHYADVRRRFSCSVRLSPVAAIQRRLMLLLLSPYAGWSAGRGWSRAKDSCPWRWAIIPAEPLHVKICQLAQTQLDPRRFQSSPPGPTSGHLLRGILGTEPGETP